MKRAGFKAHIVVFARRLQARLSSLAKSPSHSKYVAIALAVIFFAYVKTESTIEKIISVPVDIINLKEDYKIKNINVIPRYVRVRFRIKKSLFGLIDFRLVRAVANMKDVRVGLNRLSIDIDKETIPYPSAIKYTIIGRSKIRVRIIPNIIRKVVKVNVVIHGSVAQGYKLDGTPTVAPSTVSIKGLKSIIDAIDEINTHTIDITAARRSIARYVKLIPRQGIRIYPRRVYVKIPIKKIK